MSPKPAVSHIPAHLTLQDFDNDDAFDSRDDNLSKLPYIFSPDAIREEMARNMPDPGETWEEGDDTASIGGSFSNLNTSVSTLDIGPHGASISHTPPPLQSSPLASSLSANFSRISLSSPADEHHQLPFSDPRDVYSPRGNGHELSQPEAPRTPPKSLPSPPLSHSNTPQPLTPSSAPIKITQNSHEHPLPSPPHSSPASTYEAAPVPSPSLPTISTIPQRPQSNGHLTEKPPSHRPHRSVGPSAFEKVRSKTRPTFLPPKPRREDDKHMADWQKMMKQSRLAGAEPPRILLMMTLETSCFLLPI